MGAQESKLEQPPQEESVVKETVFSDSKPSSPILTPLDPRSPSANIARTPLEVILNSKSEEEPVVDQDTEENISDSDTKESVNVVLGVDPRSPTVEFNRTPIIIGTIPKEKSMKLQNKNLNNVLKSEIQTTPTTKKTSIPPKLLETTPVSVVTNYNKRKSFVGLLETNIDFTETDLDTVCQAKENLTKSLPIGTPEELPCNNLQTQMEALHVETNCNNLSEEKHQAPNVEKQSQVLSDKVTDEKVINITAQVKDFDKKLTNLIYEDDSDDIKLVFKSAKPKENNRTPLSIRNSNDDPIKTKSRLKVSDKPRKSDSSRIPVFKDHYKKGFVQCENTPPTKLGETQRKPKVSHWDADKTLII